MKRIFIILVASLFLFTACDTNPGVSKAFAKYSHEEGVTSITVPGWLISLGASLGDLSDEERELLDCIDKVKVLAIENDELNARINLHKEFHAEINKNKEYEELLTVRDKDENVTIFAKMDENVIKEMVILVGGDDNVMVYLKGEIKPEQINNTIDLSNSDKFLSMKF
ncbi:MAG: DUF4252 domain-containing protein [Bacteroidetes bacterium]|nr:DUF4252 domain-containing protein [Bacteroidota bacterium]